MKRPGTVFYTNEADENGKPRKHIRIPDDFAQYLEDIIQSAIIAEFENSNIPKDKRDRQSFFNFLVRFKDCWDIIMKTSLGLVVAGAAGAIIYLIRISGEN